MPSLSPEKQQNEKQTNASSPSTTTPTTPLSSAFRRLLDSLLTRIASLLGFSFANSTRAITYPTESNNEKNPGSHSSQETMSVTSDTKPTQSKTVVVLGCAYGGARAAQVVAAGLPAGWRLVVLERNTHANHVYVMPRYAVLPGHEYKAFVPYTNVFLQNQTKTEGEADKKSEENAETRFTVVHAQVTGLSANSVTYKPLSSSPSSPTASTSNTNEDAKDEEAKDEEVKEETLAFDYAIYALGAHMPPPLDLWATTPYSGIKSEGCKFFLDKQAQIEGVKGGRVLVVGGGALGIQFATDIKAVYPTTHVTLLHSRDRLLPRFSEGMHEEIVNSCQSAGIDVILGERLDLGSLSTKETTSESGEVKVQKVVKTVTGREIVTDLVLMCTGQTPNTQFLAGLEEALVEPRSRYARVHRTLQVASRTVYQEGAAPSASAPATTVSTTTTSSDAEVKDAEAALANLVLTDDATKDDTKTSQNDTPYPHIFAIGDSADAFGAIPAGHTAYAQGEVAARNILRLIAKSEAKAGEAEKEEALEEYTPGPPAIKVSLGLERAVYQVGPNIGVKTDGVPDLQAAAIWPYFGIKVEKDEDMRA